YRLALDKPQGEEKQGRGRAARRPAKEERPYLQGWAVVENTTDEDWSDVRMALISGRPISFQMNLYDALFIRRPVVEPELFASLRPVTYSGGLETTIDDLKKVVKSQERVRSQTESLRRKSKDEPKARNKEQAEADLSDMDVGGFGVPGNLTKAKVRLDEHLDLKQGVQS